MTEISSNFEKYTDDNVESLSHQKRTYLAGVMVETYLKVVEEQGCIEEGPIVISSSSDATADLSTEDLKDWFESILLSDESKKDLFD